MKKQKLNNLKLNKHTITDYSTHLKAGKASFSKLAKNCLSNKKELVCYPAYAYLPINPYPVDYSG